MRFGLLEQLEHVIGGGLAVHQGELGDDGALELEVLFRASEVDEALVAVGDEKGGDDGALDLIVGGGPVGFDERVTSAAALVDAAGLDGLPLEIGAALAKYEVVHEGIGLRRMALGEDEEGVTFE